MPENNFEFYERHTSTEIMKTFSEFFSLSNITQEIYLVSSVEINSSTFIYFNYSYKNHRFHPDSDCFPGISWISSRLRRQQKDDFKAEKYKKATFEEEEHSNYKWKKES